MTGTRWLRLLEGMPALRFESPQLHGTSGSSFPPRIIRPYRGLWRLDVGESLLNFGLGRPYQQVARTNLGVMQRSALIA
jgi:hypothetical protein